MKPKWTAFTLAIVIFLGGVTGGIFLDRLFLSNHKKAQYKHFKKFMGPKRFEVIQKRLQKKFTRELELTSQQQAQLREILTQRMTLMKSTAAQHDAVIESMKEQTRQEIFKILTPAQKERFAQMIEKYKARRARR